MMTSENAPPGGPDRASDLAQAATAELDGQGRVIAWTRAAERLLGYRAEEILHRPATELLAVPGDAAKVTAVARWCRAADGWGGSVAARHRDGRNLQLAVQATPVLDGAGHERWSVLALEEWRLPGGGVNQLVLEPFLAHAPVGMAVLDTALRYVWVNDALERLIPSTGAGEEGGGGAATAGGRGLRRADAAGADDRETGDGLTNSAAPPTRTPPRSAPTRRPSSGCRTPGAGASASGTWSSMSPSAGGPRNAWPC